MGPARRAQPAGRRGGGGVRGRPGRRLGTDRRDAGGLGGAPQAEAHYIQAEDEYELHLQADEPDEGADDGEAGYHAYARLAEAGDRLAVADAAVDVRFVMLWEQLATHFRGRGGKLLFELYNEPHGRLNGEAWNVLAARALGAVRKTNPDRVVVIGPTSWNGAGDLRLLRMPNDANLIAKVHAYLKEHDTELKTKEAR